MDRTIIAPYRAEEKELSQILHSKLQGLALLHPPSEDLKKCLSDEMFVKPNQPAFFHVMHYLFRLIDQNEFKKRFYWPITDKRSESNFRTSTVEYLKYLNEKHQLNWPNIKSYLVVMPGGMKFISFLLDFVHFIIQELIKQKEKQLNTDSSQHREMVTEENLQKMCKKDAVFKEMASGFLNTVDVINKRYMEKVQMLTLHLEELAYETGLSVDQLTDDKFLMDFEDSNTELFEKYFSQRTQRILEMEQHVAGLKDSMDKFYSKESGFKYDAQKIRQQLRNIRDHFSIENLTEASIVSDDGVNINTLIKAYNYIHETIQSELAAANKRPAAGIVKTRLLDVQNDLEQIESQITDFLMVIKSRKKKRQDDFPHTPVRNEAFKTVAGCTKRNLENTLLMKYVSTPPIKLEMPEGQHGPSRLSLVDSKATANSSTFNSFLAPPRTTRQTRLNSSIAGDQSMVDLNNTMNRSKLIDPMQLLRTINKDNSKIVTTPKANISSLGSKWKERQSLFNDKDDEVPVPTTPTLIVTGPDSPRTHRKSSSATKVESSIYRRQSLFCDKDSDISSTSTITKRSFATSSGSPTIIQSPYTPFNSNERTRIARPQYQLWDTNSFTGGVNNSTTNSWSGIKKMSAVKKVQDASLNFTNLSTSPSGRLEPLVTAEDFDIPKLKLNDLSLIEQNISLNNSIVASETSRIHLNSPACLEVSLVVDNIDQDGHVTTAYTSANDSVRYDEHPSQDEDALFNISDSVLKDVIM